MPVAFSLIIRRRARIACALGALLVACNSSSGPDSPSGVTAVSGNDQYATVGSAAPNPLVVEVVGEHGDPLPNVAVNWSVSGGGGTVADSISTSDASGHATMSYTAGTSPGVATVVASVAQLWTTTFTLYIEPPGGP